MKLNKWQRIGIALSIIWAFGAAYNQHVKDVERANNQSAFGYNVCVQGKAIDKQTDLSSCDLEKTKDQLLYSEGNTGNAIFIALVPIPFAWLAAYIVLYFWKVQVAGVRQVLPWGELTRLQKIFVSICTSFAALVALFALMDIMNMYVDAEVPVSLSQLPTVIETGNNLVELEGTWTREGATAGDGMGFPLQTSRIICYRDDGKCFEAEAEVSGNLLGANLNTFDIESWSDTTIVFKDEAMCAATTYTVDRKTQSVNGIEIPINANLPMCSHPVLGGGSSLNAKYHLTNGFNVYWAERQKARPWLLKIIQTLFGN